MNGRRISHATLRSVRLTNFKSVQDQQVTLRPLTVVVGANSSGKSTLLQSILLLAQAAESGVPGDVFPLNGPLTALGDFGDVLNASVDPRQDAMGIEVTLVQDPSKIPQTAMWLAARGLRKKGEEAPPLSLSWSLGFGGGDPGQPGARISSLGFHTDPPANQSTLPGMPDPRPGLRVEAIDAPTDRIQLFTASGFDEDQEGRYSLGYAGSVQAPGDEPIPIAGIRLEGGIPQAVLVEQPKAPYLAREWTDALRRAQRFIRMRETSRFGPLLREVERELADLLRRKERAKERNATEQLIQLERRERNIRSRLAHLQAETREAVDDVSESSDPSGELVSLAQEHIAQFLAEARPLSGVGAVFDGYFSVLRRTHSWPEAAIQIPPGEVLRLVDDVASQLVEGTALVEADPAVLGAMPLLGAAVTDFFRTRTRYLGPLREDPQPVYKIIPGARAGALGNKGENTAAVLQALQDEPVHCPQPDGSSRLTPLREAVTQWVQHLQLAEGVTASYRGRFGIELTVRQSAVSRDLDLTAVGVGVSQTLPVIVACLLADPGSLVILEQPELHLHPAVQQRLADFFVACVESGRQLLVETHSEYLVSRLRLHIAQDVTDQTGNAIQLLFAKQEQGVTTFDAVETTPYGALEEWPEGFFDQAALESERILRAGLTKRKAKAVENP